MTTFKSAALCGSAAGIAAVVPMSIAMAALRRCFACAEESAPPYQVTMNTLSKLGALPRTSARRHAATAIAHTGFSAVSGGVYALVRDSNQKTSYARGLLFGAVVWAGSYLGMLPALSILPLARKRPARWHAYMLISHFVWGLALEGVLAQLYRSGEKN